MKFVACFKEKKKKKTKERGKHAKITIQCKRGKKMYKKKMSKKKLYKEEKAGKKKLYFAPSNKRLYK